MSQTLKVHFLYEYRKKHGVYWLVLRVVSTYNQSCITKFIKENKPLYAIHVHVYTMWHYVTTNLWYNFFFDWVDKSRILQFKYYSNLIIQRRLRTSLLLLGKSVPSLETGRVYHAHASSFMFLTAAHIPLPVFFLHLHIYITPSSQNRNQLMFCRMYMQQMKIVTEYRIWLERFIDSRYYYKC
jgi:hypothetical protein